MLNYTILQDITTKLWNYTPESDNVGEKVLLSLAYINLYKLAIDIKYSEDILKRIETNIFSKGPHNDLLTIDRKNLDENGINLILLYYRLLELKTLKEVENYVKEFQEDVINIDLDSLNFINFQILYYVYERTVDNRYKNKILEKIEENIDQIKDYRFYVLLYLLTRNSDYLVPAYALVEPTEGLSKDEALDYYIWEISGYEKEYYPTTLELRKKVMGKTIKSLDSADAKDLYLASAFAIGEVETWKHDLFSDYTPIINEDLDILIDEETNVGILGRTKSFHKK